MKLERKGPGDELEKDWDTINDNDKILYFPSCTVMNILHIYSNIIHLGVVVVNKITRIMMRVLHAWGNLNR